MLLYVHSSGGHQRQRLKSDELGKISNTDFIKFIREVDDIRVATIKNKANVMVVNDGITASKSKSKIMSKSTKVNNLDTFLKLYDLFDEFAQFLVEKKASKKRTNKKKTTKKRTKKRNTNKKKPSKKRTTKKRTTKKTRRYVNNAMNRKLGRVGRRY